MTNNSNSSPKNHRHYTSKDVFKYTKYSGYFFIIATLTCVGVPLFFPFFKIDYYPIHLMVLEIFAAVFYLLFNLYTIALTLAEFLAQLHHVNLDDYCERCKKQSGDSVE